MLKTLWLELRVISMAHFLGAHSFQLVLAIGVLERSDFLNFRQPCADDFCGCLPLPSLKLTFSDLEIGLPKRKVLFHTLSHLLSKTGLSFLSKLEASPKIRRAKTGFWPTTCESLWRRVGFFFNCSRSFGGGLTTAGKMRKFSFFHPKKCFIHNINQVLPSDLKLGAKKVTFEKAL